MKKMCNLILTFRFSLVTLLFAFVFSQCNEMEPKAKKDLEVTAISSGLKAFIGNGHASLSNVSNYFLTEYNLNFESEYQKLRPSLVQERSGDAIARTTDLDLTSFQDILNNNGIVYGSASYYYLSSLSAIFENGIYTEWDVQNLIQQMRTEIEYNYNLSSTEKTSLLTTWDAVTANYYGLVDVSYTVYSGGIYSLARTKGWFQNAWRVVRSVVLTAAVGALVGWYAGGPVGAIVGAIVTGGAAIADAWANDYCHFAMQCDGGWRQECSTGVCAPYI